jgi:tetratricopeptide (TPR) repeat protein
LEATDAFQSAVEAFKEVSSRQIESDALRGELEARVGLLTCLAESIVTGTAVSQTVTKTQTVEPIKVLLGHFAREPAGNAPLTRVHTDDRQIHRLGALYLLQLGRLHRAGALIDNAIIEDPIEELSRAHRELADLANVPDLTNSAEILADAVESALALANAIQASGRSLEANRILRQAALTLPNKDQIDSSRLARLGRHLKHAMATQ